MKRGYLSEYFNGVAAKRLSAVEAYADQSNQHEFNGDDGLKRLFGTAKGKQYFDTRFLYLSDDLEPISDDGRLTWYDARENHPTRTEFRLYFTTSSVSKCSNAGDLLVIGRRLDGTVLVIIVKDGSTASNQIRWLFDLDGLSPEGFSVRENLENEKDRIEFASRLILDQIGVQVETKEDSHLDAILQKFGAAFPNTRTFSEYARSTLPDVSAKENPDVALIAWMEREEVLFRTLEGHLLSDRLEKGFAGDVDGFLAFSLSVQNRRKSRVGLALENHLEAVFKSLGIQYSRTAKTENKTKPDFLFPGQAEYSDVGFPADSLRMLGVKSTCKDRWRQVLAEADRIERKHLLTLELAISTSQTDEMKSKHLQLVIPKALHATYSDSQQIWLQDLTSFSNEVLQRQSKL